MKLSEIGVLTEIDIAAFADYCQSYARWKEAQEHIDSEGQPLRRIKGISNRHRGRDCRHQSEAHDAGGI